MNSLRIFSERTALSLLSKRSPAAAIAPVVIGGNNFLRRRSFSTAPQNDHDGKEHDLEIMSGYMEYLDGMLEKATSIEGSLHDLKQTYEAKKKVLGSSATAEIHSLFEKAESQKEDLSQDLAVLKAMLKSKRAAFAVEAPDGLSDESDDVEVIRDLDEADQIIDYASKHEDVETVRRQHKSKEMAGEKEPKYWSD